MNLKTTLAVLIACSMGIVSLGATAVSSMTVEIASQTNAGSPTMILGQLGSMNHTSPAQSLKNILKTQPGYGFNGNEDFKIVQEWTDFLGKKHVRFEQTIDGLKVYGAGLVLHANPINDLVTSLIPTSSVYALSGTLAVSLSSTNLLLTMKHNNDRGMYAYDAAHAIGKVLGRPELSYIYLPQQEQTKLAWRLEVEYQSAQGFENDLIFYDANSNQELTRHPKAYRIKSLSTHDMENREIDDSFAPGTLLCTTGQRCNDLSAQRAHSGASETYDYLKNTFGRDGIDDRGMTIVSSVHTGVSYGNAVFNRGQMFYGDGDGEEFTDLTKSYDVIAHELLHGVTDYTAKLKYRGESGALNESISDILAISAKARRLGQSVPDWMIGEEVTLKDAALRIMNNPTKIGASRDYYPERYTGVLDNGGVHFNSGIMNLAYVLLVEGGKHPRRKTDIQVGGIGLSKAEQIFYRALTTYFTPSTNFAGAKSGTEKAALDLYGAAVKEQVTMAWCAVGVGRCSNDDNDEKVRQLQNGEVVSNINLAKGDSVLFTIDVPPSSGSSLRFEIGSGHGDADLYIRRGSAPTDREFDCRPYKNHNDETCEDFTLGGIYFVRIKAYESVRELLFRGSFK